MYQWQRFHIFDELGHYSHHITVFNPLNYKSIEIANEELIKHINTKRDCYDLFMTCVDSNDLYPETVYKIKRKSIPALLICFDNLQIPHNYKQIAPCFDLVWLTSPETKYLFDKWGSKSVFLPYAANPFMFKPCSIEERQSVGFIGTPYGARKHKLMTLVKNSIEVEVYSQQSAISASFYQSPLSRALKNVFKSVSQFEKLLKTPVGRKCIKGALKASVTNKNNETSIPVLPPVSFEEMVQLYSDFKLSLGVTELWNTYTLKKPVYKLHLRTFEIPMCGGAQIVTRTEEIGKYFDEDKEIVLYNGDDEFIDKCRFYLNPRNEPTVKKIKINARKRAEKDHTWNNRFNRIFSQLGLF